MKKIIFMAVLGLGSLQSYAQQEVIARLDEAKSSHSAGKVEDARYALQQCLVELDILICKEILAALPDQVAGLNFVAADDFVSGNAMGIVGSSVQRNYKSGEKTMNFNLMNNSPMMNMVSALLTNPLFSNSADGSQKQIKVAGNKAVLQKNMEVPDEFTIQIPLHQSLLTLEFIKFSEQEAINAAEALNIEEIKGILD